MTHQYTKDELWDLFDKLPQELKGAVFSEENAEHISRICERYDIAEPPKIAYQVGLVLMGVLLPEEFEKTLVGELEIEQEKAARIARDIHRFVFYPVKPALNQLHKPGGQQSQEEKPQPTPGPADDYFAVPQEPVRIGRKEEETPTVVKTQKKEKSQDPDLYRETLNES